MILRKLAGLCLVAVPLVFSVQAAAAQQVLKWKHGLTASDLDSAFSGMLSEHDIAKKQGVEVEFVKFNSDALALKALISGEIDSYEGSPGNPLIGLSKGVDVKLIGCYWPGLTYGIYSKNAISSPSDLAGKTIGISAPNSLPDILTRVILRNNKVDPKNVSFAALGSDNARFAALYAGSADAIASSTSSVPVLQNGFHLLTSALESAPEFLRLCTYVSPSSIRSHREALIRFLAAEMIGINYALQHRTEFLQFASRTARLPENDPRAAYIFDEAVKYNAIDPSMAISVERVNWMKSLLIEAGSIEKDFDVATMIDTSLRDEAIKRADLR